MGKEKGGIMKKNKGFTLIELLVAITVLAIIVVPMLKLFVSSARMNGKARRNSNAISIAENIMEGIKANSIADLTFKFNYPNTPSGNFDIISYGNGEGYLINTSNGGGVAQVEGSGDVYSVSQNTTINPDGKTYEFTENTSGKYSYCIKNVTPKSEKYVAIIDVDASPYRDGNMASSLSVNSSSIVDMEKLRKGADASFLQNSTMDDVMLTTLRLKGMEECGTDYELDSTDPYTNLYRKIKVDIEKNGTKTDLKITYEYKAKNVTGMPDIAADPKEVLSLSEEELSSLMLFYTPLTNSKAGDVHDEIEINNKDDIEMEIYLIRSALTPSEELTYRVNVSVNESAAMDDPATEIKSNIDDELSPSSPRAVYYNNGMSGDIVRGRLLKEFGASNVTKDRLYDVTIKVYRADEVTGYDFSSADVIYELNGSTQE